MEAHTRVLVGVDAGASKAVAIAVTPDGVRRRRAEGGGANPKRHGLDAAADRVAGLAREAALGPDPDLLLVAGAGIDRPEHARDLEAALAGRLPATRIIVVNDTLAALRAATPDCVGLAVPVSTGGNVLGRGPDGRVTDRGHGIFGGAYVLGALAARAVRRTGATDPRGLTPRPRTERGPGTEPGPRTERGPGTEPGPGAAPGPRSGPGRGTGTRPAHLGTELRREIERAEIPWHSARRPDPQAAILGAAVVHAAEAGDPYPARMVDRWCRRVTAAVAEEVRSLGLGEHPAVVVYGGLLSASPWLGERIRAAVLEAAPGARLLVLDVEPAEGAALLARDAWRGAPIAWDFVPRR